MTRGGCAATSTRIFVQAQWPTPGTSCQLTADTKFDVALVEFPAGTYGGRDYAKLLGRSPVEGEDFTIVGYGNSVIEPFDSFCTLARGEDGMCHVYKGTRTGTSYNYESVLSFPAGRDPSIVGCPVPCTSRGIATALTSRRQSIADFVESECDGNLRDRSYRERGVGTKRSGSNTVAAVRDGVVEFVGSLGGEGTGIDAASGAGDSGGPLFIFERGQPRLAAVTHGGSLVANDDTFRKATRYVDLGAPHNLAWIRETVSKNRLNCPGL